MCLVSVGGSRGGERMSLIRQKNRGKLRIEQKMHKYSLFVKVEEGKASIDEFKDILNESKATFQESKKDEQKKEK